MRYGMVLFLCLAGVSSGCMHATVVGNQGVFESPALPASIEEWERSHKQTMISDHLNEALEAYRTAPDDEKARRWEEVKQIQGLYEASDLMIHPTPVSTSAANLESTGYLTRPSWQSSGPPARTLIEVYEKDTGRVIAQVGIRGTEIPAEFKNSQRYGFRAIPL